MFPNLFGMGCLILVDNKWVVCYTMGYEKANTLIHY